MEGMLYVAAGVGLGIVLMTLLHQETRMSIQPENLTNKPAGGGARMAPAQLIDRQVSNPNADLPVRQQHIAGEPYKKVKTHEIDPRVHLMKKSVYQPLYDNHSLDITKVLGNSTV